VRKPEDGGGRQRWIDADSSTSPKEGREKKLTGPSVEVVVVNPSTQVCRWMKRRGKKRQKMGWEVVEQGDDGRPGLIFRVPIPGCVVLTWGEREAGEWLWACKC
jgi:hypothetical protein